MDLITKGLVRLEGYQQRIQPGSVRVSFPLGLQWLMNRRSRSPTSTSSSLPSSPTETTSAKLLSVQESFSRHLNPLMILRATLTARLFASRNTNSPCTTRKPGWGRSNSACQPCPRIGAQCRWLSSCRREDKGEWGCRECRRDTCTSCSRTGSRRRIWKGRSRMMCSKRWKRVSSWIKLIQVSYSSVSRARAAECAIAD